MSVRLPRGSDLCRLDVVLEHETRFNRKNMKESGKDVIGTWRTSCITSLKIVLVVDREAVA